MRGAALVVLIGLGAGGAAATGCKSKSEAAEAPDPGALKEQQDLLARRDKLLAARAQMQQDREQLEDKVKDIEAKGGDASAQKQQIADIDNKLSSNPTELGQVNAKLDELKVSGDKAASVAAREADLASREARVAEREARVAEREKSIVQRDGELAQRWKDSCTTSAPVIIQQAAAPKAGGNYTKKDVSDLIAHAKAGMQKKGLLAGDLPGPAQGLEGAASAAINDNDMSKAYFAAAQLAATVDSIAVDRAFIQQKIARLQNQIKSSKQDAATTQQLSSILSDVIQKFGDGNFGGANQRLNQLAAMLR